MIVSYTCSFLTPFQSESMEGLSMVVIPTAQGKLGLLPRHAPMTVKIKSGVVAIYKADKLWRHYFVWGGLARVGRELCEIFTETFTLLDELDPLVLGEELERYHNDLAGLTIEDERRALSYKIAITEAMIQALKEHHNRAH